MVLNLSDIYEYKNVVIFGNADCFHENIDLLDLNIKVTCVCLAEKDADTKGFTLLTDFKQILLIENPFVLIASNNVRLVKKWGDLMKMNNLPHGHILFYARRKYVSEYINALDISELIYKNNHIITGNSNKVTIEFCYDHIDNCTIQLGHIHVADYLTIQLHGSGANVSIGEKTSVVGAYISVNSGGQVIIGKDCMLSLRIGMYQSDEHHIFDLETGKRINKGKNISIGNHVWIGRGVVLLGGFSIEDNSIVGSNAVSSGQFGANLIVAGCPAKMIRENIIWSRDGIDKFDRDFYYECNEKAALDYLPEEYREKIGKKNYAE